MWELLFLLLPFAALSGFLIGRKRHARHYLARLLGQSILGADLGNETKKTVDVFMQLLDHNQETVETHLALGNLFRRRGEVDKAISVHQNLMAKPSLTQEQRATSLLELSRDYMRAGVLDRAETLLLELVEQGQEVQASFEHLIDIYQQSKDWLRAIETAQKLQQKTKRDMSHHIAHFYCELAEQRWLKGNRPEAYRFLRRALNTNKHCVRASLLMGDIQAHSGFYKSAINAYKNVERQDKAFISEIMFPLSRCYEQSGAPEGMVQYLNATLQTSSNISVVLAYADWLCKTESSESGAKFIASHLRKYPSVRGLKRLIQYNLTRADGSAIQQDFQILQELIDRMVDSKPLYRCHTCGFTGRTLQWQCPSCKRWDVIKPIAD